MPSRGPVVAVIVALMAALALVGGTYSAYVAGPTIVRFDGLALNITYGNGSSGVYGPPEQNACHETLPPEGHSPADPNAYPSIFGLN